MSADAALAQERPGVDVDVLDDGGHGPATSDLVTVVIPARNEEAHIGACLESVLGQHHRHLQVIVVDGASTDATAAIVDAYASRDRRVELIANPQRIIPVSLNLALAQARGRWLVRVDAHSTIPPDYVTRAVERLREGWGGVGGRKDGVGRTAAGRAIAAAMASRFGVGNSTYHYGTEPQVVDHVPFGAYPVDLARELGGWDGSLRVNQDFEFDHRVRSAGRQLLFDPGLSIDWHCRQSIGDLFRQYHRYGHGKVSVIRKHPGSVRARHLAAPALTALLVAAAIVTPWWPWLALGLVAPYVLALLVASFAVGARLGGVTERITLPAAFLAMHVGWGLGFWSGLVRSTLDTIHIARQTSIQTSVRRTP